MGCWGANSGVAITVGTPTELTTILLVDAFLTYHCLLSGWFDLDIHVEAFTVIPSGCHLMDLLTGLDVSVGCYSVWIFTNNVSPVRDPVGSVRMPSHRTP